MSVTDHIKNSTSYHLLSISTAEWRFCYAYSWRFLYGAQLIVSIHRFPLSNRKLCKKWIRAICQPDFKPSPHHLLCSDHFEKSCFLPGYVNRRQLKKNAIPTLFRYLEKVSLKTS
jgi:hypothetical protein